MAGRLDNLLSWLRDSLKFDLQVILVHDKQDDETSIELKEILRTLASPKVELIEQYVGSPGLARNLGLKEAKGRWIHFVDSDDVVLVPEILNSIALAEKNFKNISVGRFCRVNEQTKQYLESTYWTSDAKTNLQTIFIDPGIWRFSFQRNRISGHSFENLSMAEDILFLLFLSIKPDEIFFYDEVIYKYSVGSNTQLTNNPMALRDLVKASRLIKNLSHYPEDYYKAIILMRIVFSLVKRKRFLEMTRVQLHILFIIIRNPEALKYFIKANQCILRFRRNLVLT